MLTTYQKKNAVYENEINKIKNEIKETEIKPMKLLEVEDTKQKENELALMKEDYDKANSMVFSYNDLNNWANLSLNKFKKYYDHGESSNNETLSERFKLLSNYMSEIVSEIEKFNDFELGDKVKYLDDDVLRELDIKEQDHLRQDNKITEENDDKD